MDVEKIQYQIDSTNYWDAKILDVRASYFCDEIEIFMECDEKYLWKFKFEACNEVQYFTDAVKRKKILYVKNMNLRQMGYYGQSIIVSKSDVYPLIKFEINLSLINIRIECLNFILSKELKKGISFWWDIN